MIIQDLKLTEYAIFYSGYISKIPKDISLIDSFELGLNNVTKFFNEIPKEKLNYSYAEDKWTIKEVFQHIIDTERIFMYRCFRLSRHDHTALSGFEQNDYIEPSHANNKSIESLLEEYQTLRQSFIVMLKSFNDEDLNVQGNASGNNITARAAAFIIIGHELWHMDIIKERYL